MDGRALTFPAPTGPITATSCPDPTLNETFWREGVSWFCTGEYTHTYAHVSVSARRNWCRSCDWEGFILPVKLEKNLSDIVCVYCT